MAALIDLLNRKKADDEECINLLDEIQKISRALERAYERFELQSEATYRYSIPIVGPSIARPLRFGPPVCKK